jgi:diaminopropionate ammonia-lyase
MITSPGHPPRYENPAARAWTCAKAPAEVQAFHAGLPGYAQTPLTQVPAIAAQLGVGRVFVKDESARLGLPAFKVLGASWAGRGPDGAALRTAGLGVRAERPAPARRRSKLTAAILLPYGHSKRG